MGRLFGTDGVRGQANTDLTAELALSVAVSAARVLTSSASSRPFAVVGRDPRASGEFLEAAVVAGLASAGVDVRLVGVLPTPGVAYLTDVWGADLGVMLSASHNSMPDNGIKFFARGGVKLDDDVEDAIEAGIGVHFDRPVGAGVGRVTHSLDGRSLYAAHLISAVPHDLSGVHVVVDCANGAASTVAAEVYAGAGARVTTIHDSIDGLSINDGCGSTHLEDLQAAVLSHGADVGIAHDGDADRCLAVDASGNVIDGDHILAILALAMRERSALTHDTVVATVMANLGFRIAMADNAINVIETAVGDRYVLEAMRESGAVLGGEQSGHVVMSDHSTTGDGILTGLHLLARVAYTGASLAELASVMTALPQVLINVRGVDRSRVKDDAELALAVSRESALLGDHGRVLLRPSGTEPVVRVMVEAATHDTATAVAERLADVVRERLAL